MASELEQARKALRELGKSLKNMGDEPAPKAVHKLRTAARRVEALVAARQAGDKKLSRRLLASIEPIRKAAGGVREMDVLKAHARGLARRKTGDSLVRLLDHLASVRREKANELWKIASRRRDRARQRLKEYSKQVKTELAKAKTGAGGQPRQRPEEIHAAAATLLHELEAWPAFAADNLHGFRLKVKQLRYTLQLDEKSDPGLLEALGEVQKRVGDWHDWQQLDEIAREVLGAGPDNELPERISRTTQRRFAQALEAANRLRSHYLAIQLTTEG